MTSSRDVHVSWWMSVVKNLACKQGNSHHKFLRLTILWNSRTLKISTESIYTANGSQKPSVKFKSAHFRIEFVDKHGAWNWHLLLSGKQDLNIVWNVLFSFCNYSSQHWLNNKSLSVWINWANILFTIEGTPVAAILTHKSTIFKQSLQLTWPKQQYVGTLW